MPTPHDKLVTLACKEVRACHKGVIWTCLRCRKEVTDFSLTLQGSTSLSRGSCGQCELGLSSWGRAASLSFCLSGHGTCQGLLDRLYWPGFISLASQNICLDLWHVFYGFYQYPL